MGEAASHRFLRRQASPALVQAMQDLAERTGRTTAEFEGTTLGEAYSLAVSAYGANLPDFWRIWNDWNTAPDELPEMGEL
jgi:hypothetical protein